ncbi:MAG: RsmE family RNA methyltransferase [Candidatus Omnitrophota bacterium]
MHRIYYPRELIKGSEIVIDDVRQAHYLFDVLRLGNNDQVCVFDGQGSEYYCQIQELSKRKARLLIKGKHKIKNSPKPKLAIACALLKQKSRFDDLVNKLSQLGVDAIIPMLTERVVIHWDAEQKKRHHERWCNIAKQACSQSKRNTLPVIEPVTPINQLLSYGSYELKLIATPTQRDFYLRDIIFSQSGCADYPQGFVRPEKQNAGFLKSILILIGPEGDFTKQELAQAKSAKFIPIFLGEQILRVDTAALAVAAFIRLSAAGNYQVKKNI